MKTIMMINCCICVTSVICGSGFAGTRASANYSITTETIDSGGVNASSVNYSLHGSAIGEFATGNSGLITSTNYSDKLEYVGQLSDMLDPITAGSQFTHGSTTFTINLPLFVSPRGVECRQGPTIGSYTVVFTFGNTLTSVGGVSASATGGGPAPGATGMIDGSDAHRYIVSLANVPNAQYTTISLSNVSDSDANFSASVQTTMGALIGDTNASGRVDAADVSSVRQQTLQPITTSNFREDLNASGRIDAADVSVARQHTLTSLPSSP
jgi:hypothetical protein